MQNVRKSRGQMPYRRRCEGLSTLERMEEHQLWQGILCLVTLLVALPIHGAELAGILPFIQDCVTAAVNIRRIA